MPREITSHKINECNEALKVTALDEPGVGGACCRYQIAGYSRKQEVVADSLTGETEIVNDIATDLNFQNGPIAEVGTNGITHEVLLAILIDRLEGFESGPYACLENAMALTHLRSAQASLHLRTKMRLVRGVEGNHQI